MNLLKRSSLLLFAWILTCMPLWASGGEGDASDQLSFKSFDNDPTNARIYTLDNGLKVYLSVNGDEPRIQTYIGVRSGSKHDPADNTGLAHYLEHMLFKGTSNFGTTDFKVENTLIEQIAKLYEQLRKAKNDEERKVIYKQIDQLSFKAASYAIPNEYDKVLSSLGASGTNAWTSKEQTVYTNNVPSNELERWLQIESERFSELVLRLFHTELEAVYEEFNMSQDRDGSRVWKVMFEELFPGHPYGTQTTIGEGEHLKNPSMYVITQFFQRHYIPSNMAICLAGDFDPDEAIGLIRQYFGGQQKKGTRKAGEKPPYKVNPPPAIKSIKRAEVVGPDAESIMMAYRLPAAGTRELLLAMLTDGILNNGTAGLMDLNLLQAQKVLSASSFVYELEEHSSHILSARPRAGQSLEECEALLLSEIQKLRDGEFEDWLIDAVIQDLKRDQLRRYESNGGRAGDFIDAFTLGIPWDIYVNRYNEMENITREDIMNFAQQYYGQNYVVVYKRQGESEDMMKVEKPPITPIEANREAVSPYVEQLLDMPVDPIKPKFVNYRESISDSKLKSGIEFSYVRNRENNRFQLYYIFDMGKDHDPLLDIAVDYLPFLGTDKFSAEKLQQEFYKIGVSMDVFSSRDRVYVQLSGLDPQFAEGVKLFEEVLASVQADQQAWDRMVDDIIKSRQDAKKNKRTILWQALYSYAQYGSTSPFTDRMSEEELRSLDPKRLAEKIKSLYQFEHKVFYYGSQDEKSIKKMLKDEHRMPDELLELPAEKQYALQSIDRPKVYFVNYDMVQAQFVLVSRGPEFDRQLMPMANLYNEYFGSGLSSIVFQEIRETRALAYSAFSSYSSPSREDRHHFLRAYVATQADKMPDAMNAMRELLAEIPYAEQQFVSAKDAVTKKLASNRSTRAGVYWNRDSNERRGINYDFRQNIYHSVQDADFSQLQQFFNQHVKGASYHIIVMGNRDLLDMEYLQSLGEFEELSLEEIFGY
jgi:predicted Zn-dependent peptidase